MGFFRSRTRRPMLAPLLALRSMFATRHGRCRRIGRRIGRSGIGIRRGVSGFAHSMGIPFDASNGRGRIPSCAIGPASTTRAVTQTDHRNRVKRLGEILARQRGPGGRPPNSSSFSGGSPIDFPVATVPLEVDVRRASGKTRSIGSERGIGGLSGAERGGSLADPLSRVESVSGI